MNGLITVNTDTQTVSARELHEKLNIGTRFNDWFPRMTEYGFAEGTDFYSKMSKTENGGRPSVDYEITLDMAKQICMIQRTPEGKMCRQYLIDLEKAWNTPEQIMARALKMADRTIESLKVENKALVEKIEQDKPKTIFADAVSASDSSILMRDLAKLIRQNGVEIGEKRLYKWMRERGYIRAESEQDVREKFEREVIPGKLAGLWMARSRRFELKEMLVKIDTLWVQGSVTDEQRTELIALAQENAKVENSINILNKLEELDKRVRVLEDAINKSDCEEGEGETEGDTEGETEEVVAYPEYEVGRWYYRGDMITFDEKNYKCIAPETQVCTWNPYEYPAYWELIIPDSEVVEEEVTENETTE